MKSCRRLTLSFDRYHILSAILCCLFVTGCHSGKKREPHVLPARSEKTIEAQAFLYDLRIVDGTKSRTGKAELYATGDSAVLRIKGYLGSLGAIVYAEQQSLSVFLPRDKRYSTLYAGDDTGSIHCNSIWRLWPLLRRPAVTEAELDSLHAWTIVNRSEHRQQLLWQHPLCSLTVLVRAKESNGRWYFDDITASQVDGYIRLTLREFRASATVPTSRFQLPDTLGWGAIPPEELSLSLDGEHE